MLEVRRLLRLSPLGRHTTIHRMMSFIVRLKVDPLNRIRHYPKTCIESSMTMTMTAKVVTRMHQCMPLMSCSYQDFATVPDGNTSLCHMRSDYQILTVTGQTFLQNLRDLGHPNGVSLMQTKAMCHPSAYCHASTGSHNVAVNETLNRRGFRKS